MSNPGVEPERDLPASFQAQDVAVGGNFQVDGEGNRVDFSQTHVDQSHAQISHTHIVQVAFDEVKTRPLNPRSPYIGLRKFEVRDRDLFFGRDRIIAHLQERLQDHFLLVLGASGSGKSSLIRAGLIPQLAQQQGGNFRELICTPDRNPFESFRASLTSAGYRQSETEFLLAGQPDSLLKAAQTVKPNDDEWLIFIDQFEELFTLCADGLIRQNFIDSLVNLVRAELPSLNLVVAMRADFLDRLSAYPSLSGILQCSELITDLGDDELGLAIEQPAARHGVVFEPNLVGEIIQGLKGRNETGEAERISLPLLQYTLKLLWESSGDLGDRILRTSTYRQIGGVRGALQRRVDEIYNGFSIDEQQLAKHIFLQLVDTTTADVGTTAVGKAVSRRATLAEFQDPGEQKVLEQLINASLLVSDRPSPDSSAMVELAHETLIDSWDTLKSWIEESKPLIRLRNQLKDDATRWHELHQQNSAQADAELWQGSKMQWLMAQKQELCDRFGNFRDEENAFINASEALSDQEHHREVRRLRRTIAGVGVALAAVSGLAFLALNQWIRAEQGQIKALTQTTKAEFTVNRDTLEPLLYALEAGTRLQRLPTFLRPPDIEADVMTALAQGVYWVREKNRLEGHNNLVDAVAFNPKDGTLATVSHDKSLKLWNSDRQLMPAELVHDERVLGVDFSHDGQMLASSSADGVIKLWTKEGKPIGVPISAHDDFAYSVRFNPVIDILASAGADGKVKLWTFQGDNQRSFTAHQDDIREVDFITDGLTMATASDDGTVGLWDLYGKAKPGSPLTGHQAEVNSVRFSPNQQWLASGSDDGTVRLWTPAGNFVRALPSSDGAGVWRVAFSPDSRYIATALDSGVVEVWDTSGERLAVLKGHATRVKGIGFSPNGRILASASADQSVKLWEPDYGSRLTVLEPPLAERSKVSNLDVSAARPWLAASRYDSKIALWPLDDPKQANPTYLEHLGIYGTSVSFSPDGQYLVSADLDDSISLWTLGSPTDQPPLVIDDAHQYGVNGVNFSPQGRLFASAGGDQLVKIWDSSNLRAAPTVLTGHQDSVNRVQFNPNGEQLISVGKDGKAILWNVATGKPITELEVHAAAIWGVAFSPQGDAIATASADDTVKLWSSDGKPLHTLRGHTNIVMDVQFSKHDMPLLFSASDDRTIKVWRDEQLIATLIGHSEGINALSLNHSTLISAGVDGKIILWNTDLLSLENLLKEGCTWAEQYFQTQASQPNPCKDLNQ